MKLRKAEVSGFNIYGFVNETKFKEVVSNLK